MKKTFNKQSREFLLKMMPKNGVVVEVGVWMGVFTEEILSINQPNKLYLVDPYKYIKKFDKSCYGNNKINQVKLDGIYDELKKKYANKVENKEIEFIRKESNKLGDEFKEESLDWVYIDGNHSYNYVKSDLMYFSNKIKKGGYITGDDYGVKGWWGNGVKKAVDEFLKRNSSYKLVLIKNRQYILQKY